ncbi:hypothetical protein [Burkholderia vietnamiensis]|uniref:hypothetical protein n=1 Tax=Burkholderia vietnamiensis TaxID=60552 RepID=UPI001CF4F9CC|nr:hypothetical protein [Burkholderia vietnamiensis]MCA8148115.1 hypothetical protein [Burkholderia vietnamiensis]
MHDFDPFAFASVGSYFSFFFQAFLFILGCLATFAALVVTVGIIVCILRAIVVAVFGEEVFDIDTKDTPQKRADGGPSGSTASSTDDAQTTLQAVAIETAVHSATDAVTHSQGTLF